MVDTYLSHTEAQDFNSRWNPNRFLDSLEVYSGCASLSKEIQKVPWLHSMSHCVDSILAAVRMTVGRSDTFRIHYKTLFLFCHCVVCSILALAAFFGFGFDHPRRSSSATSVKCYTSEQVSIPQNVICFQTSARLPQAAPLFFPRDRFGPEITYRCLVLDSESRHTRNLGPCCWTHWSVRIVLLDHSSPVTVLLPLQRSAFPLAKMCVLLEKNGEKSRTYGANAPKQNPRNPAELRWYNGRKPSDMNIMTDGAEGSCRMFVARTTAKQNPALQQHFASARVSDGKGGGW